MKGFTLIEIVIYLTIAFLVFALFILMIFNLLKSQEKFFYQTYIEKEKLFLKKKILYLFENSKNFQITTSTNYFKIDFYFESSSKLKSLIFQNGKFYLNSAVLTSKYFDYSSSTLDILSTSPLGVRVYIKPNFAPYLNINSKVHPLEIKFYLKNE